MTRDLYDAADVYDLQYRAYRDDLPYYRSLALDRPGTVLEVGAGTGRVTVELARTAERVVALEPSEAMRARARARLDEAGVADRVEVRPTPAEALADVGAYALAVAPFHVLMHLHDLPAQDAALAAIRRSLAPGGLFACDVAAPRFGPEGVLRHEATWQDAEEHLDLWLLQRTDPARQTVESRYLLDRTGPDGRLRRERVRLVQRWFHRFELQRALASAGFEPVRIFGDFDRRPVDADSPRLVAEARVPSG